MLYMSTRTQIYLTDEQRQALDERAAREGRTLADLIREAVDDFLAGTKNRDEALASTFGTHPDFEVPDRDEWDRG
jgi:predicted DNA-binding protein